MSGPAQVQQVLGRGGAPPPLPRCWEEAWPRVEVLRARLMRPESARAREWAAVLSFHTAAGKGQALEGWQAWMVAHKEPRCVSSLQWFAQIDTNRSGESSTRRAGD